MPSPTTVSGRTIVLPDYTGVRHHIARDQLYELNLVPVNNPFPVDDPATAGFVLGTEPTAGTVCRRDQLIQINVGVHPDVDIAKLYGEDPDAEVHPPVAATVQPSLYAPASAPRFEAEPELEGSDAPAPTPAASAQQVLTGRAAEIAASTARAAHPSHDIDDLVGEPEPNAPLSDLDGPPPGYDDDFYPPPSDEYRADFDDGDSLANAESPQPVVTSVAEIEVPVPRPAVPQTREELAAERAAATRRGRTGTTQRRRFRIRRLNLREKVGLAGALFCLLLVAVLLLGHHSQLQPGHTAGATTHSVAPATHSDTRSTTAKQSVHHKPPHHKPVRHKPTHHKPVRKKPVPRKPVKHHKSVHHRKPTVGVERPAHAVTVTVRTQTPAPTKTVVVSTPPASAPAPQYTPAPAAAVQPSPAASHGTSTATTTGTVPASHSVSASSEPASHAAEHSTSTAASTAPTSSQSSASASSNSTSASGTEGSLQAPDGNQPPPTP